MQILIQIYQKAAPKWLLCTLETSADYWQGTKKGTSDIFYCDIQATLHSVEPEPKKNCCSRMGAKTVSVSPCSCPQKSNWKQDIHCIGLSIPSRFRYQYFSELTYQYRYFQKWPYRYRYFSKVSIYRQSICHIDISNRATLTWHDASCTNSCFRTTKVFNFWREIYHFGFNLAVTNCHT